MNTKFIAFMMMFVSTNALAQDSISDVQAGELASMVIFNPAAADVLYDHLSSLSLIADFCGYHHVNNEIRDRNAYDILADAGSAIWQSKRRSGISFTIDTQTAAVQDILFGKNGRPGLEGTVDRAEFPDFAVRLCENTYSLAEDLYKADAENPNRYDSDKDMNETTGLVRR